MTKQPAQGWHRQQIIAALRMRGTSLRQLSLQSGLQPDTLYTALRQRYPRANAIIADALGQTRHALWPHWFGPQDDLLPLSHHPIRKRQKAAA